MATNDGYEPYGINHTAAEVVSIIEKANVDYSRVEIDVIADTKANDNAVVKLSGAQTISGQKNFTDVIIGNLTGNVTGNLTGNSDTSTVLQTPRTITLTGNVTGSVSFNGSQNVNINSTVVNDSHTHTISTLTGVQSMLNLKAPLSSPEFTGTPVAPTPAVGVNSAQIATTAFVNNEIQNDSSVSNNGNLLVRRDASGNFSAGIITATLSGNASSATNAGYANTAGNANQLIGRNWYWSGQGGQPTWVWGGSDGSNMYVYNPSNFSVAYATNSGTTNVALNAIGQGQTWQNVTSSRASDITYTNSTGRTIMVSAWSNNWTDGYIMCYVNGVSVAHNAGHSEYGHEAGITFLVPPNSTYSIHIPSLNSWVELR